MKKLKIALILLLTVSLVAAAFSGCGMEPPSTADNESESSSSDTSQQPEASSEEAASASTSSARPFKPAGIPEETGTIVEENEDAVIDYSNTEEGYVMVDYIHPTENRLKIQVVGPQTTYNYDLQEDVWTTFPLSDGDGEYKVTVYESRADGKYTTVLSAFFDVVLESEFAPFLHSNQYVNYAEAKDTMSKTAELTAGASDTLEIVANIYNFVTDNLVYDTQKAANIQSGYLPVLDEVLGSKKAICFDYASLMAGMLRSCEIPCKLVVGYSGDTYHAWVNVWCDESGWVDEVIFFDGQSWQLMDPTFDSANDGNAAAMQYIGNGDNYVAQYQY